MPYEHIIAELERIKPKHGGSVTIMRVFYMEVPRHLHNASDEEIMRFDDRIAKGNLTPDEVRDACRSLHKIFWIDDGGSDT